MILSPADQECLTGLLRWEELVFELIAPVVPELSVLDQETRRPFLVRVVCLVDRSSELVFGAEAKPARLPLGEALRDVFVKGLRQAQVRPGAIHVDNARLAAVLDSACQALGIDLHEVAEVNSASSALFSLTQHLTRPDGR